MYLFFAADEEKALSELPVLEENAPRLVPLAAPLPLDNPDASLVTALRLQMFETSVDMHHKISMVCKRRADYAEYARDIAKERLVKAHKAVTEAEKVVVDAQYEYNEAIRAHTNSLAFAIDATDTLSTERARAAVDFEAVARGM